MPRGNKTGPEGAGPMTGRAAGYCIGYAVPGFMNPRGYGRGFGRGLGRGFRRGWYAYPPVIIGYQPPARPPTPEQEVTALENYQKDLVAEKAELEKQIDEIKTRLEELKAKPGKQ